MEPSCSSLLQNVSWAISNLCRGTPTPPLEQIGIFIKPFVHALNGCEEGNLGNDIKCDAAWGLSYIAGGGTEYIDAVMKEGAVPLLMHLVHKHSHHRQLMIPTIRALGNIASGTDDHTKAVLKAGFLQRALGLLGHQSVSIKSSD